MSKADLTAGLKNTIKPQIASPMLVGAQYIVNEAINPRNHVTMMKRRPRYFRARMPATKCSTEIIKIKTPILIPIAPIISNGGSAGLGGGDCTGLHLCAFSFR